MVVENWLNVVRASIQQVWITVMNFLPSLLGALLVFIIGLIVSSVLDRLVERLVHYLKLDALLRRLGVEAFVHRANMKLDAGVFLGRVVYWFFILVFTLAASEILGFAALSAFLGTVLMYIPQVLVAILILLVTLIVANFLRGLVRASVMSANIGHAKALGTVTWWTVVIFGLSIALDQVGVAMGIINTLITGVIAMLALAGGLAFGLGGREHASRWLSKLESEMTHHQG